MLIFDIEANGLKPTRVFCLCIYDTITQQVTSCADAPGYTPIAEGVAMLQQAEWIGGHNVIAYDIPILQQLCGLTLKSTPYYDNVYDTLIAAQYLHSDILAEDEKYERKLGYRKGARWVALMGSHSLRAWGQRLKEYKDDFTPAQGWENAVWTPEMSSYCEQDVITTARLYKYLSKSLQNKIPQGLECEFKFAQVARWQHQSGYNFDFSKAGTLLKKLEMAKEEIVYQLKITAPEIKNINSNKQLTDYLVNKYGWEPKVITDKGNPKLDTEVLKTLDYPIVKPLLQYKMIQKRISQLYSGKSALMSCWNEETGCIHGHMNTIGTVTYRCAHNSPNLAQVPACGVEYGADLRSLFGPPKGWVQVGCDASGLELRCLAHYTARYDGGAYIDAVTHGDIHSLNQKAAGLATRAEAKTFIYALNYGSGDEALGKKVGGGEAEGRALRERFYKAMPGLATLTSAVKQKVEDTGIILAIDKRQINVRYVYTALNCLLQSCGAIAVKYATIILHQRLYDMGWRYGVDYVQLAHVHDEYQLACPKDKAKTLGELGCECMREAGRHLKMRCPLDGEYKIGHNWAECH